MKTHVLTAEDVGEVIRNRGVHRFMDELIERLAGACREHDPARTRVPARAGFAYSNPAQGLLEWMPLLEEDDCVLLKTVGYHPANPSERGLPSVLSVLCRFDPATGHLISLTDGTLLTAMRTGAASAVASRILARPGSRRLGLVGCGAQAVTQFHALLRVFEIEEVLIHDTDPRAMESFAARARVVNTRGAGIRAASIGEVVGRCDLVCTATSVAPGEGPVLPETRVQPWLHVNAVGSDFPEKIELPLPLLRKALVCPDFLPQAIREGECQQLASAEIGPDLVELVRQADSLRAWQERLTVFDSTGWAKEDLVAVNLLLELATKTGAGRHLEIECITDDPQAPYEFLDRGAGPGVPAILMAAAAAAGRPAA